MPDGSPGIEGEVVIINYEDDPEDTIVPRFEAAGGDLKRLLLVNEVQGENGEEPLTVPTDILELENFLKQNDVALVVIDPLMAALAPEVKSNVDHHIRRALAPLKVMAERAMPAVIVVRHLNKNTKISSPILRGGGSIGIIGAARAGLIVGVDPEDSKRRVLAVSKMNLAPDDQYALAYRVISDPDSGVGVIEWLGKTNRTGHSLRAGFVTSAAERGARAERIMDHTGHRSAAMVRVYTRRSDAFQDHAGEGLL